nr:phospholipase A(1) DAD1, chloroplastic-like [Ipomoea batatas]
MSLPTATLRPYNTLHATMMITNRCTTTSQHSSQPLLDLKITTSTLKITTSSANSYNKEKGIVGICNKWMEYQGIKDWEGLLDPLDDQLRMHILSYGHFVEAAYRSFDFDVASPTYATCRYEEDSMLARCGLGKSGYKVVRNLYATSAVCIPRWMKRVSTLVSPRSSWIGYVAVCDDVEEISRLGHRNVVIAFRGTATMSEWLENLRVTLTCLPDDMAPADCTCPPMVQSGLLSLYTSSYEYCQSLRDSIREEMHKILEMFSNDNESLSITITGHSLGAALAILTAYDITTQFCHAPPVTVVSFGGPRVGNHHFRSQLEANGTKILRIVNSDDPITKVPGFVFDDVAVSGAGMPRWLRKWVEDTRYAYAEVGKELRLSSKDCPEVIGSGNVATCHDLKTYLHLINNFVSSNCPLRATAKRVIKMEQSKTKASAPV